MFEREVAHMGHDAWNDVTPGGFNGFATFVYHGFDAGPDWMPCYTAADFAVRARISRSTVSISSGKFMMPAATRA